MTDPMAVINLGVSIRWEGRIVVPRNLQPVWQDLKGLCRLSASHPLFVTRVDQHIRDLRGLHTWEENWRQETDTDRTKREPASLLLLKTSWHSSRRRLPSASCGSPSSRLKERKEEQVRGYIRLKGTKVSVDNGDEVWKVLPL